MRKTVKFTVSMSAAEFKYIESLRHKAGRTRSQLIRDAVAGWRHGSGRAPSIREDQSEYGAPPNPDFTSMTDIAERRRRAIAAAGRFRSGAADLSSNHDRYFEETLAEVAPRKTKPGAR